MGIKVKNWPGLEFEYGESKRSKDQILYEHEQGLDAKESDIDKAAKVKRQKMFDEALSIRSRESKERPLTEEEIRGGKDVREARFMQALGVRAKDQKAPEPKTENSDLGKSLLETLRADLADLKKTLATHGVSNYRPLEEFQKTLDSLESISLKENDTDDDDPEIEYRRQSRSVSARMAQLRNGG